MEVQVLDEEDEFGRLTGLPRGLTPEELREYFLDRVAKKPSSSTLDVAGRRKRLCLIPEYSSVSAYQMQISLGVALRIV
ncbi:hypothetical protein DIPPA_12426 [Diplonema papillatum]|nr:hypothetical protein DIPPA_12426 [Diplonema papillatum]